MSSMRSLYSPACFNPRPRAGGDAVSDLKVALAIEFQSTPPRGRRRRGLLHVTHDAGFNPRPRAGGDDSLPRIQTRSIGFNPRPRAGGDADCQYDWRTRKRVSIHAPAREATILTVSMLPSSSVSIHAPAREATPSLTWNGGLYGGFNPRPRAGGDVRCVPAKGDYGRFNPRPRAGGDSRRLRRRAHARRFNPRPRAGGDSPTV